MLTSKYKANDKNEQASNTTESTTPRYYKLPFVGAYSSVAREKVKKVLEKYCKDVNIRFIFTTCKVGSYFSNKDPLPRDLASHVVYKYACASCNACYIGQTHVHYMTRVHEHLVTDKASSVYKHIHDNSDCMHAANTDSFSILDRADTRFKLKIKEAIHVNTCNPALNVQKISYKLSLLI